MKGFSLGLSPGGRIWPGLTKTGNIVISRANARLANHGAKIEMGSTESIIGHMAYDPPKISK